MTGSSTKWLVAGALGAGSIALLSRRKSKPSKSKPRKSKRPGGVVPSDVEFGEAPFPTQSVGAQWDRVQGLTAVAERETGIEGLYSFLMAVAHRESAAYPSAINTETDGIPALKLFCSERNFGGRYRDNPWRPQTCAVTDPMSTRWAYSGGLFGLMPATALATSGDHRGNLHDPARVFDAPFAVAYATDLARRLRIYGARTWGDVRGGWALLRWAKPSSTAEGKARVLERLDSSAKKVAKYGVDPHIGQRPISTRSYPGFGELLHALLAAEGRTQQAAA